MSFIVAGARMATKRAISVIKKTSKQSKSSNKTVSTSSNTVARETANRREIDRLVTDLQMDLIEKLQDTLSSSDINFSGDLSNSIHPQTIDNVKSVVIDSPYATLVDKGIPPNRTHIVNYDKLRKWVEGKLGITDPDELNAATFKIQKKIETKGIQPTFFVKKAIKALIAKRGVTRIRKRNTNIRANKTLSRVARNASKVNRMTKKASSIMSKFVKGAGVK